MKKFFILKFFLLISCACLAKIDDCTPNFKAVIHNKRSGYSVTNCSVLSWPLLDYKFIFPTLRVVPKNKNLIERLEQFKSILKQYARTNARQANLQKDQAPVIKRWQLTYTQKEHDFNIKTQADVKLALCREPVINGSGFDFKNVKLSFITYTDCAAVQVQFKNNVCNNMVAILGVTLTKEVSRPS